MRRLACILAVALLILGVGAQSFKKVRAESATLTVFAHGESFANSALELNKTYGGTGSDFALAFVQTVDGGYALAGRTYSFGAGGCDFWLVKTDAFGNHLWNRIYGGTRDDCAHALIQTADGGYALSGTTYSFGAGSSDFWLVKTDSAGNMLWNRTYGGIREDDPGHFVVQTADGGYVLAGRTYSFGTVGSNIWLIKTDASGNMLWNRTYGGSNLDGVFAFVQTVDGGYALAGHTYSFGAGNSDFWLVKTDSAGNLLWNRTYGGTSYDCPYALVQTVDGGYALIGETLSFGAGESDVWLVRTDASGNHLWNKTYGGTSDDGVFALVQTIDGGYALAGHTYSFGAGNCNAWLMKTSADGSHEWNETYGGTDEDYASRLIQTSDDVYVLAGSTKSFGAGGDDFWLVKTEVKESAIIVPDDYLTIQEAINSALDGDTIYVKPGIYYEHVVINKAITLIGEDANTTIIDGNNTGHVINVVRDNVNIISFTVQRSGSVQSPAFDAGICLNGTVNCTISGIRAIDNGFCGISLQYSEQNTITRNNLSGAGYFGIWLLNSSRNTVSGNIIDSKYGGITGHQSSYYNNITENVISNSTYGMFYHAGPSYNNICGNNISNVTIEGIQLQEASSFNIAAENNVINCGVGIKLIGPNYNNSISANFVAGCQSGIKIQNARYTDVSNNTIAHNYGSGWDAGLFLDSAGDTLIHDNEITDNWRGIQLAASSPNVTIYGNNVTNNEFGIRVWGGGSDYLNVSRNFVANNRGYGVAVTGIGGESNHAVISGNVIVNNVDGVALGQGSSYNTVVHNNISENEYGIGMENSTQNSIWNNNIINNTYQVSITSGSVNAWDDDYPTGGNYWSDYTGVDANGDGLGDTPYVIDERNVDRYPLMKPWTHLAGDVNGDEKVDMKDISIFIDAFMVDPSHPKWNSACDINNDLIIDMADIAIAIDHFIRA